MLLIMRFSFFFFFFQRWIFLRPAALLRIEAWLRKKRYGELFGEKKIELSAKKMLVVAKAFSTDVIIINHCHGERVHVPPKWMHAVANLLPNIKLAFDFYDPLHFPAYLESWREVISHCRSNAPDYMAVHRVLVQYMIARGL